ncbi:MAG: SH3 domain-containing protein [Cyanobacteria bacterium P01_F01_bin.143]
MTKQTWVSTISSIFQFIIGFILGVTLIAGVGAGMAYWYFTKMSAHTPTKPVFEDETKLLPSAQEDSEVAAESIVPSETTPEPEPIPEPEPELPPNAYFARVTWPQGLSLRAEPALDAERIGGIDYNARIIILEESSDKRWQRVRIPETQREAWVKAGNVEKE